MAIDLVIEYAITTAFLLFAVRFVIVKCNLPGQSYYRLVIAVCVFLIVTVIIYFMAHYFIFNSIDLRSSGRYLISNGQIQFYVSAKLLMVGGVGCIFDAMLFIFATNYYRRNSIDSCRKIDRIVEVSLGYWVSQYIVYVIPIYGLYSYYYYDVISNVLMIYKSATYALIVVSIVNMARSTNCGIVSVCAFISLMATYHAADVVLVYSIRTWVANSIISSLFSVAMFFFSMRQSSRSK